MLVTLMLAPACGFDISRPARPGAARAPRAREPRQLVDGNRLPRALQVAGGDVDHAQALLDGQVARRQLQHHAADLIAEATPRVGAAHADRADHTDLGGNALAARLEPTMQAL